MNPVFFLMLLLLAACGDDDNGPSGQGGDSIPPAPIRDLDSATGTGGELLLIWTAPGDDWESGIAKRYDVRYSVEDIDEETWSHASRVESVPSPAPAGTRQQLAIEPIIGGGDWFFGIRTVDGAGNMSSVSNILFLSIPGCRFDSVPSTEVDFVFGNLDGSMECMQPPSYLDQLSDDFVFVASPGVQAQFPTVFPDENAWGLDEEETFVYRLFADADSIQSDLKMTEIDRSGTQTVLIEAEYRVRVVMGDGAITYAGVAFYTLRQEATTWFLTRWEETASSNPLGLLRGRLAQ